MCTVFISQGNSRDTWPTFYCAWTDEVLSITFENKYRQNTPAFVSLSVTITLVGKILLK